MTAHRAALRVGLGATALATALVVLLVLGGNRADDFIAFGATARYPAVGQARLGADVHVRPDDGHDGQAFWLLAHDPFLNDGPALAAVFDWPSYRAQRVLYPLLAQPGRLFGEWGLAWALIVVNVLALGAGSYVTARVALELGAPAAAGWAFVLNPALLIALRLDLSDVVAVAALMTALLFVLRRQWAWAVAFAALTVLTREVLVVCFLSVALFHTGIPRRVRILLVAVPGALIAAWALYLRIRMAFPAPSPNAFTPIPFKGYYQAWTVAWAPRSSWDEAAGVLLLTAGAVWVGVRWWQRRTLLLDAALPLAASMPFLSALVLDLSVNAIRAIGPVLTLAVVDVLAERRGRAGVNPPPTGRSPAARTPRTEASGRRTPPGRAGSGAG